jgi:hypothetical protein
MNNIEDKKMLKFLIEKEQNKKEQTEKNLSNKEIEDLSSAEAYCKYIAEKN